MWTSTSLRFVEVAVMMDDSDLPVSNSTSWVFACFLHLPHFDFIGARGLDIDQFGEGEECNWLF